MVNYKLMIYTDSYTGNFYNDLIHYVFGRTSLSKVEGFDVYAKSFFDSVCGTGLDTYEHYLKFREEVKESNKEFEEKRREELKAAGKDEAYIEDKIEKMNERLNMYNLENLYKSLEETYQWVDDWQEDRFYNICISKDKEFYSGIYVQMKDLFTPYFEDVIIERIKHFFEKEIYNYFEDYIYLCQFGEPKGEHKHYKLLEIELVDDKGNLIKKYL